MRDDLAFMPLGANVPHLTLALGHDRMCQFSRITHLVKTIKDIMPRHAA
ncbi:hypothetical protein LV564_06305 [Komagataeibacter nataicola]|nr:hypothetical protein [Komagataeibacter nataicola]WEQ56682.1 hypothetical protein LV564_06305 [Komagataeibacter nataicola]WNM08153.1 hypothetical protein RI056_14800 [Komagataeibacter nataicola]